MKYFLKLQMFLVETIPTAFFLKISQRRALKAFGRAIRLNPVYANLFKLSRTDPKEISDIESFKKLVPISEKNSIFHPDLKMLPIDNQNFSMVKTILVSSGSSGNFSFGLKSKKEIRAVSKEADFALESYFSGISKKTMIVNCLPMGSKVYCSIDCSDVGPHPARAMASIAMAKRIGYEQVFVMSLGHIFLKELLEYDDSKYDISWDNVFFFTGGEFFPESARSYFIKLLGRPNPDDSRPRIGNSGGITELMLNSLFFESPSLIKIREAMLVNTHLRDLICGKKSLYTPSIFCWNPLTSYLELIDGFITITNLESNSLMPLIRYKLEDRGQLIDHEHLKKCLSESHLESLIPKEKLPILLFWGRSVTGYEHIIQEHLYSTDKALKLLTANFIIQEKDIYFQLKRGMEKAPDRMSDLLSFADGLTSKVDSAWVFHFIDFEKFGHNMGLNYENKFTYSK